MSNWINETAWLFEMDFSANTGGAATAPASGQPPASQPGSPGDPMGQNPPPQPEQGGPDPSQEGQPGQDDISADPQYPDMPDQQEDHDFESWRIEYFKESIKGDPNKLMDMLLKIRNKDMESHQQKFVEDNLRIVELRQHQDILIPSKKIRQESKTQLDQNAPGTSLVDHIASALEESPLLNEIYIKLKGCGGGKSDYHRKFIAALLGAVQVGNGKKNEDLVLEDKDFSVRISTRFASEWGNIFIGPWMLKEDDPHRYLKAPELNRLEGGSPEEKDVLKRRIIMESIAQMFEKRAFIIDVVGQDGTIVHLGLDLGNCLRAAYVDGRLVVRTDDSDDRDAFIDDEGSIVAIPTMSIHYVRASDKLGEKGDPEIEELEFIKHDTGMLKLVATADLIKESSSVLQGMIIKEAPFQGNPTDLQALMRSVPSVSELLLSRRY